jgi:hypothetical protein
VTPAEALAAVVAGEDAAIYAHEVAGARLPDTARQRARTALDSHRAHRSQAAAMLVAVGGTVPGAAAAYALPADVSKPKGARATLATVDNALVGTYADAAAALGGEDRRWAARTGAEYATSAVIWGADTQAFPR